jgi:DNA-binding NarL/FixJ family response regulator
MRIVLADDHVMLRDGLKPHLYEFDPKVEVLEAGSYPELFDVVAKAAPVDIALVDLRMPGMNGLHGLETLCRRWPDTRVAVLSSMTDRKVILDALAAGAVAFIPKRLSVGAMLSALRLVLAGERFIPAMLLAGDAHDGAPELSDHGRHEPAGVLTQREKEILRLLRDGLPNKAIARHLNVSEVTVKSHLCHVFRKLGVQNRVQAARLSLQNDEF